MPIEELLELVDTLRTPIDKHSVALGKSEALTRYALIDPLLRELGWNTADPQLVIPEFNSGSGRADYALLSNGKPLIMLEAKSLGSQLDQAAVQGINYCNIKGTAFFCVTDGQKWRLYETFRPTPIEEKIVVSWDIGEGSGADACLKAAALWRASATSGKMTVDETPVVGFPHYGPNPTPPSPVPPPPSPDEDWQPLTEVKTTVGQKVTELQFPGGERVETKIWRDVLLEIVRWLSNKEMLDASHCPIKSSQSSPRCMVNTKPNHEDGKEFGLPGEVNGLYIAQSTEHHHNLRIALAIIRRVSQDPSQFKVRVS